MHSLSTDVFLQQSRLAISVYLKKEVPIENIVNLTHFRLCGKRYAYFMVENNTDLMFLIIHNPEKDNFHVNLYTYVDSEGFAC